MERHILSLTDESQVLYRSDPSLALEKAKEAVAYAQKSYRNDLIARSLMQLSICSLSSDSSDVYQYLLQAMATYEEYYGRISDGDKAQRENRQELARQFQEKASLALVLIQKDELLHSIKEQLKLLSAQLQGNIPPLEEIISSIDRKSAIELDWKNFEQQFNAMYSSFIKKLLERYPLLSKMEVRVCMLLRMNLSTKAIADLLSSSVRTIENHRLNIRKKLALAPYTNLLTFLTTL